MDGRLGRSLFYLDICHWNSDFKYLCTEQQPVETNLKATLAGISVVFPSQDENQNHLCDTKIDLGSSSDVLYLCAECRDILLVMQVITVLWERLYLLSLKSTLDGSTISPDALTETFAKVNRYLLEK